MTRKYQNVRREMYERDPASKVHLFRSFFEMRGLFKRRFWILAIIFIIVIIIFCLDATFWHDFILELFLLIALVAVSLALEMPREKYFYNEPARKDELSKVEKNYEDYIKMAREILSEEGINTPNKVVCLKNECNAMLKKHENTFGKINSRLVDMFIGVPLGALIASIIYSDSKAIPAAILMIFLIGIVILVISKFASIINYYSEGYFKDKYLLNVLNELDYSDSNG